MTDTPRIVVEVQALARWCGRQVKDLRQRIADSVQDDDPRLTDARTPTAHTHATADVTGLGAALSGKADLVDGKVPAGQLPESTGGGGAGIDDEVTSATSTWSSEKVSAELAAKADDKWTILDENGDPVEGADVPLSVGVDIAYLQAVSSAAGFERRPEWESEIGPIREVRVVNVMPEDPQPNQMYAIRASDGTVTWKLP